jgi:hypothetical protein
MIKFQGPSQLIKSPVGRASLSRNSPTCPKIAVMTASIIVFLRNFLIYLAGVAFGVVLQRFERCADLNLNVIRNSRKEVQYCTGNTPTRAKFCRSDGRVFFTPFRASIKAVENKSFERRLHS